VGEFPIWLGSGLAADNAASLWPRCDGAIVGTACKRGGRVDQRVDAARVKKLVAALRSAERARSR
jgi:predicted TIM-barrel enzyme